MLLTVQSLVYSPSVRLLTMPRVLCAGENTAIGANGIYCAQVPGRKQGRAEGRLARRFLFL